MPRKRRFKRGGVPQGIGRNADHSYWLVIIRSRRFGDQDTMWNFKTEKAAERYGKSVVQDYGSDASFTVEHHPADR